MNRIVASKNFLRPHVSRVLSVMRQTDSSIVGVNFAARNPMFQYNERMSRKLFVGMVRRRSSLRFLERKRTEISQCILPVKSRFAPKTQPPSKLPWAWHGTLVRPLFLPSSNLWMGFFNRRGYVTCMERLTCPEFRISEERAQEEEYLLRHPWTGSRLRAPRGITSEMLSEPERVVLEDGEPRLLPTIRAAKSNLKTAKQSLLFEQRSEGKTLPYLTKSLVYKNPPKEFKEEPSGPEKDQATPSYPQDLSSEREFLKEHLGDLLLAPERPIPVSGLGYHRDAPTRRLLNEGMIQEVRAKVPEIMPIPPPILKRYRTYIVGPTSRVKVHFAQDSVDPKDTKTSYLSSLKPSSVVFSGIKEPELRSRTPAKPPSGIKEPLFKSKVPTSLANYSRRKASGSAAPVQSRTPQSPAKPSPESVLSGIKDPEFKSKVPTRLANHSRWDASHSAVRMDTRTCCEEPKLPKPKPRSIVPNSLLRTKTAAEAAPVQPKKERCLRVPVAVMEFVREQELAAMKTKGEEVKAPRYASRNPIRKPPGEPVEVPKQAPNSRWSKPRPAATEGLKKELPVRVPFAVKDFITQHNLVPRSSTRTWYMRDLGPSSGSDFGEAKVVPQNETKTSARRAAPPPPVRRAAPPPPVRRAAPPPPVRRAAPPPPVRRAAPTPPVRRATPPPSVRRAAPAPPPPRHSVVPPKRKPQAKVPEQKICRWKY